VYLGHIFAEGTVTPNTAKFKIIEDFPSCRSVKDTRRFLGMTSVFRRYITDFAKISFPLRQLLKQSVRFQWTEECENAFRQLKQALMTQLILQLPDPNSPIISSVTPVVLR